MPSINEPATDNYMEALFVHDITYWPPLGPGFNGKDTYGPPVAIRGRWSEYNRETFEPNKDAVRKLSGVIVDRDLELGGVLWLGKPSQLPQDPPDPSPLLVPDAWVIRNWRKVADIDGEEYVRRAFLGDMPTYSSNR